MSGLHPRWSDQAMSRALTRSVSLVTLCTTREQLIAMI